MNKERTEQLQEARATVREYEKLLELPGWTRLQKEIAAAINSGRDVIESTLPKGMDDMLVRESVLGEIRAGRRIIQLPEMQLAAAREVVKMLLAEEQENSEIDDLDETPEQEEYDERQSEFNV